MNNELSTAADDDAPPVRDASLLTPNAKPTRDLVFDEGAKPHASSSAGIDKIPFGVASPNLSTDNGEPSATAKPDVTRRPTPKAASLRLPHPERSQPSVIVEEGSRPRIERLREASLDVLEEASEDSGLRFVLVAFMLFLLFLLCLFISIFLR